MSNSLDTSDWDDNLLLVVPDAHVGEVLDVLNADELDAELFMMGDIVDGDVDVDELEEDELDPLFPLMMLEEIVAELDEQEDESEEDKPGPFFDLPMLLIVGPIMGDGI